MQDSVRRITCLGVCVLDATPAAALHNFTDGTVDLILSHGELPAGWQAKRRSSGVVLPEGGAWTIQLPTCDNPVVSYHPCAWKGGADTKMSRVPRGPRIFTRLRGHRCRRCLARRQCRRARTTRGSAVGFSRIELGLRPRLQPGRRRSARAVPRVPNKNTEVTEGWLDALHQTFADVPTAGVVGAKLVFPNGTLHEAGSLIFRDASAMNYGRGEHPDHPAYNMLRDADYCSAASIMIPRELFQQLQGFDPLYAPAYYEDGDLAFRVRQLGRRVIYQPRAAVIHHEGGTSGTDVSQGTKRFQVVNQEKFRRRWEKTLAGYPDRPVDTRPVDPSRSGKRVLVIDHWIPCPEGTQGPCEWIDCWRCCSGWTCTYFLCRSFGGWNRTGASAAPRD